MTVSILHTPGENREDQFDLISARMLQGFPELCAAVGVGCEGLLDAVGVDHSGSDDAPIRVSYRQFVDLLALATSRSGLPDFGMRLALAQSGTGVYGALGRVMSNSLTLGHALDYAIENAHVHSRAARITRHAIPGREGIVFSHEIVVGDFASQEQAIEHILLAGHLGAVALTGGHGRARQVLLRHRPVSPLATYRRNFGCDVFFDQLVDGIIFTQRDLACPIVGHDPALHAHLVAAVQSAFVDRALPIHAETRNVVLRLMHVGVPTNKQVAAELGLHTRTLHRRLIQAGTSFQKIKDEVRCEVARYYLTRTDVSMMWIAGKLGFAEHAVFTRFCHRHFGCPPSALRK